MQPNAPSANPTTSNTNLPYGGFGQASSDSALASNILSYLPTQQQQSNRTNPTDTSLIPSVNITTPSFTAPTPATIDPNAYAGDPTKYAAAVQAAMRGLTSQESNIYDTAMGNYAANVSKYGNLAPVYQSLANSYGLPGYQQDVATLQSLLQNLTQDVNQQTTLGGGLMTESARDEMERNARTPLDTALSNAQAQYQLGQTNVENLLNAYQQSVQNELEPLKTNIANLPTLFGQANQAADTTYGAGASAIENAIQNRIQQEQANSFAREVAANYGAGGNVPTNTSFVQGGGGNFEGMTLKNPKAGATAGYNFVIGGKPASAATWAAANGQNPATVIAYMARQGDPTAQNALAYITLHANDNNGSGPNFTQLNQMFPSLMWQPNLNPPATPASSPSLPTSIGGTPGLSTTNFSNNMKDWFGL